MNNIFYQAALMLPRLTTSSFTFYAKLTTDHYLAEWLPETRLKILQVYAAPNITICNPVCLFVCL